LKEALTKEERENLKNQIETIDVFEAEAEKKYIEIDHSEHWFLFRQNDSFKSKWDLLIILLALFNCYFVPL
jgi:hypothetical protein